MGKKRRPSDKPSYQPAPIVPPEVADRLETIIAVIAGTCTVSEGARRTGIARNNFQTIVHRAKQALVESLAPRPSGPKPTPEAEAELRAENARLKRENTELARRSDTITRLLSVTGELLKEGRLSGRTPRALSSSRKSSSPATRSSSPSSTSSSGTSTPTSSDPEDPDPEPTRILAEVVRMSDRGVPLALAAALCGYDERTLRRWRASVEVGRPLRERARACPPSPEAIEEVARIVRTSHGLMGAEAIRRSITGVSRRQSAAIKAETLTQVERERKAQCARVTITAPGVLRGFDAMYVATTAEMSYLLIAGDAAVPYRTTIDVVDAYDAEHVAKTLERDIATHGAPLVYRLDRAACHDEPRVVSLLEANGVLILHGPPRHPGYYGQLERQNREHRAFLTWSGLISREALAAECESMRHALNETWPRATLNWNTAATVWRQRPPVSVDRAAFREEVDERAARREAEGLRADLAQRLAIEHALRIRGLLRVETAGQVLRG